MMTSVQQSSVPVAPLHRASASDSTAAATERAACYRHSSMLDESARRAIFTGISCSIPLQVGQLAILLIYSRPFARIVSPIFLFDLALTGLFLAWSRTDACRERWRAGILIWCGALCLSNGAIAVYTHQVSLLYSALIIVLVGAAVLAPWGTRWQSALALICLGTAATATRLIPIGAGVPFRSFELGAVAALTVIIAWLNERTRIEVRGSEQEMQAAGDGAEAASRAKSQFLSSMSHEIRTPMNAILGMAEVLADSPLTAEQHKYLSIMINNGGALLDLINDILDFARVESGHLKLERTSFDLHEVVERVAENLSIRAHQKKLELIVDI